MGSKQSIAGTVKDIISGFEPGPCLDLFSGMCSVAGALADIERETWCNDVQRYANLVARVIVASDEKLPNYESTITLLKPLFVRNKSILVSRFRSDLNRERRVLKGEGDYEEYSRLSNQWKHVGNCDELSEEAERLNGKSEEIPYRLASITFAYSYFGLGQAIEIDSIRYAIDTARRRGTITNNVARWCLVGLLQTVSHVSTSPGHFAQYLNVKEGNFERIRRQRKKSIWDLFRSQIGEIEPHGSKEWRSKNKVFCMPSIDLLDKILKEKRFPGVVYADPPYSKAQYSRYYHVLETLTRYDYPESNYKGLYRQDRFTTPFSHKSKVEKSIRAIFERISRMGSSIVVSYPSSGILYKAGGNIVSIINEYYRSIEIEKISYKHSTMGAAHGEAKSEVEEKLFWSDSPRS
jgi:adenine-specific DNA-methyltransferase